MVCFFFAIKLYLNITININILVILHEIEQEKSNFHITTKFVKAKSNKINISIIKF